MSDSELVEHRECPECGSSDNLAVYSDGHAFCFGADCGAKWPKGTFGEGEATPLTKRNPDLITDLDIIPLNARGLTQETCRKYGYGVAPFTVKGQRVSCQFATYHDKNGHPVAQKVRGPDKYFTILGDMSKATLFGQKFCRSGGKMIVVTEGEIDALSVSQAFGNRWPAVSINNGAASAVKAFKANLEFLESYERVVICFDQDEQGAKAAEEAAGVLSPGKAFIASLPRKDANEMLQADESRKLTDAIWGAREYRPDGVICFRDLKSEIEKRPTMGTPYLWSGLNEMLFGMRGQELTTWCSGTGSGKSSVVSELVYGLIRQQRKVGVCYLEESVARTGQRLVGLALGRPIHLPGAEYTKEEFDRAFEETLGTGLVYGWDAFGTVDLDVLMSRLRYMVKGLDCEFIVLDHISMLASGLDAEDNERKHLDRAMTELRTLCQDTGACMHVVSHLRRTQSKIDHESGLQISMSHLRGSQALAQLSDNVLGLERNQQHEDPEQRHITTVRVLKNRLAGITGPACKLKWDVVTGRLTELAEDGVQEVIDASDY